MPTKRSLAVALSKLSVFVNPNVSLEQYATDSNVAAMLLWRAYMDGSLKEDVIDLGAGTGILAIGAALLGARVTAIEKDNKAVKLFEENQDIAGTSIEIIHDDILAFAKKGAVVIMNPPFGTKEKHADRMFLQKAFSLAPIIYSIHKTSTKKFINDFSKENKFSVFYEEEMSFPLKKTMTHHKKDREYVDVILVGLKKD